MNNVNLLKIANVFRKVIAPLFRQNHNSVGDTEGLSYITTVGISALFKSLLKLPIVIVQYHVLTCFMGHTSHN